MSVFKIKADYKATRQEAVSEMLTLVTDKLNNTLSTYVQDATFSLGRDKKTYLVSELAAPSYDKSQLVKILPVSLLEGTVENTTRGAWKGSNLRVDRIKGIKMTKVKGWYCAAAYAEERRQSEEKLRLTEQQLQLKDQQLQQKDQQSQLEKQRALEMNFLWQYSQLPEPKQIDTQFERKYQSLLQNFTFEELYRTLNAKHRDESPTRK